MQIDLLILERAPQPFGEDIVDEPPAAIHADLSTDLPEPLAKERAGELTALVGIAYFQDNPLQRPIDHVQDKSQRVALAQLPCDY